MIVRKGSVGSHRSIAELFYDLGDVPLERIRARPAPGTATLEDAIEAENCELIDGVLVGKTMGIRESMLAIYLATIIGEFVRKRNLGIVTGEQGTMEILPDHVRMPDVGYVSWDRFPNRKVGKEPIPSVAPDLAVEVLSQSNTVREMKRKRRDYFRAGVRLVWEIDPQLRIATVYRSPTRKKTLTQNDSLNGDDVLPGLTIPLRDVFAELDRQG